MPALKPKVRADLAVVPIEGEAVVYDPVDIRLHHLNATAAVVFQLCDGTGTVKELAEDIAEVVGLPQDQVLPQVRLVVEHLKHSGLLHGKRKATQASLHEGHVHEGHVHG
jgi:Coenzyme PQQ synthesis protein D (PqqD)